METFAEKFERHQNDKNFHPLTCGNEACKGTHLYTELHYDEEWDRLFCKHCDYEQLVPSYLKELF